MSYLNSNVVGIVAMVTLLMFAGAGCDKFESRETLYLNYSEIEKARNPGKWIPPFVPRTARNIHEFHYVDSNSVWIAFEPNASSSTWPDELKCTRVDKAKTLPSSKRISAGWWPRALLAENFESPVTAQLVFYECPGELGGSLALSNINGQRAYFWR